MAESSAAISPAKQRPNILAGSGGRQFSFGGRPQLHARQKSSPVLPRSSEKSEHSPPVASLAEFDDSGKSPFTYALHVVFTSFVRLAEKKINTLAGSANGPDPDISALLGQDVDPAFDKVLRSLGYIARQNPKPVIDSVMFWRKSRAELKSDSQNPSVVPNARVLSPAMEPSSFASPTRPVLNRTQSLSRQQQSPDLYRDASSILADRKSLLSIFILCRTLIEIVKQIDPGSLGDDVAEKLEEIVFNQLKNADHEGLMQSALRHANWNLFSELLGWLSGMRFASVSDRFIADLEKFGRGVIPKEREVRVEMIIHGMRHLKIRTYPVSALEDSAEFLSSLARFYNEAHGFKIKQAYAEIIHHMILPVAGTATAEFNFPTWQQTIHLILPRAIKLQEKARYWDSAFSLSCTVLCVAPRELFLERWFSVFEQNCAKIKDKAYKTTFVQGVARLVWVAVFRCLEQSPALLKKIDSIFRTIYPSGKRLQYLIDVPQQPLIQLVRFIGARHQDYCFKNMILPLVGAENLENSSASIDLEYLYPERTTVAIHAFLAVMEDSEANILRPEFPVSFSPAATAGVDGSSRNVPFRPKTPLVQDFYTKFSLYLCRVAFFCDQHFGGQAVLEERMPSVTKLPFSQYDTGLNINGVVREKKQYYDLLAAIIDALPRCLPPSVPVNRVIEMICKATAHMDFGVRSAARKAMRVIATTTRVQSVVIGYAKTILKFDLQSPGGTETKLNFYLELLQIWIEQLEAKTRVGGEDNSNPLTPQLASENRGEGIELNSMWTVIEEAEAHGLFFLCSQSRSIRLCATEILNIISRFDTVINEQIGATKSATHMRQLSQNISTDDLNSRVIDLLRCQGARMLEQVYEDVSPAERSRITKLKAEHPGDVLVKIIGSESGIDAAIWYKVFPLFIQISFERFPITVVLCRNLICNRLVKMQASIMDATDEIRLPNPFDVVTRVATRNSNSSDSTIEQWKLYLMMACSTLTLTDEQFPTHILRHGRKRSVPIAIFERITSVRSVFQMVLPLLASDHITIRDAVVTALGCININLFKVLLEDLTPMIRLISDTSGPRLGNKTASSRSNKRLDRLRTEISHILQLTSRHLSAAEIIKDEWILETISSFLKDIKNFLSSEVVQTEHEYQRLRRYFCGLLEAVWAAVADGDRANQWLPFEGRVSCFRLMEEWCNHGPYEHVAQKRANAMRQSILNTDRDNRDRGALTASMEIEKRNVESAALSAMATLCTGSVTRSVESNVTNKATLSFDIEGLFAWIAAIFRSPSERLHTIGRRALHNLLMHNLSFAPLYQEAINQCYTHDLGSKAAQSYFIVLAEVLTKQKENPCGLSQLLALILFKAGDQDVQIRTKTLELLRATEMRFFGKSCVDSFVAAIANQNPVIYKKGQYSLAAQLAQDHEDQKFLIFSECSRFFHIVETRLQQDTAAIMLPWARVIELQLDVNGEDLEPSSHMVLVNLLEITLKYNDTLIHEIENLWTALVTGPHVGNVKAILDFTISQGVARREPLFVNCGKQVVVYLSRSPSGTKLVEALLSYVHPRSMIPQLKEPVRLSSDDHDFVYSADLDRVFSVQQKHVVFSLGQLALIFLVDLLVIPSPEIVPYVPSMLLVIFLMLDHYIPMVQDQAKELFFYLSYNICVESTIDSARRSELRQFLSEFRTQHTKTLWSYDDMPFKVAAHDDRLRAPRAMQAMIQQVLDMYSVHTTDLKHEWGDIALKWATSCPVRHMACRAFQVYRCLSTSIDQNILADMLARLSNSIADTSSDIQAFAMEIMFTLNILVDNLKTEELLHYPQLFWCAAACLDTTVEVEFMQAITMLDKILDKLDLSQKDHLEALQSMIPAKWEGSFEGCFSPVLKGLRSKLCMKQSLKLVNRMLALPASDLIGADSRLLYSILANLPIFIHSLSGDCDIKESEVVAAQQIAVMAEEQSLSSVSKTFQAFSKLKFRSSEDFIRQVASVLRECYFPQWEAQALVFLLGLLSNQEAWVKLCTMDFLKAILPFVDTRRVEFAGVGADLISPLLRLLQTEYAQAGLEVLDRAISIPGGTKDRQVLRMSLGNRTIRKEYEKTATLFGIPDESGWAVPMPAVTAAQTRSNVHAVFYTCTVTNISNPMTDHVQFHMEDYSYQAPSERSETMVSIDGGESTLGDMVSTLHNLDVFFTEDAELDSRIESPATDGAFEQAPASVYDSRVAAILSRSLARTPSISSFTSPGFDTSPAKERKSPVLDRNPMSPLANGFSFPRSGTTRPAPTSPRSLDSGIRQRHSESDLEVEETHGQPATAPPLAFTHTLLTSSNNHIVLDDDRSEASFKLETQLKKSATISMRSKLWSSGKDKDPEKAREKDARKREKAALKEYNKLASRSTTKLQGPEPTHTHTHGGVHSGHNGHNGHVQMMGGPGSPTTSNGHFWSSSKQRDTRHHE